MMMILSLAYRAILAEPRIKASSTEEYSGAPRSDYMGGGDTMTPYPPPLRMQPQQHFFLKIYKVTYQIYLRGFKSEAQKYPEKLALDLISWPWQLPNSGLPLRRLHEVPDDINTSCSHPGADLCPVWHHSRHGVLRAAEGCLWDEQRSVMTHRCPLWMILFNR